MIGYCFCGSFCTISRSLDVMRHLIAQGTTVLPIMNDSVYTTDTRFGKATDTVRTVETLCRRSVIHTIADAEPIGPTIRPDMLVVAPCTGNTLAKLAVGITDSPVTMAVKAQLRSDRPVVIALATNDALSANLKNIGTLMSRKNIYFVPMKQDDPEKKPYSLVCDFSLLEKTMTLAAQGKQIMPLF